MSAKYNLGTLLRLVFIVGILVNFLNISSGQNVRTSNSSPEIVLRLVLDAYFQNDQTLYRDGGAIDTYTTWGNFGPGDSWCVAQKYAVMKINQSSERAEFRVSFDIVGEADVLAEFLDKEYRHVVRYVVVKRSGRWKVDQPVAQGCRSVQKEVASLKEGTVWAEQSLRDKDFAQPVTEDYLTSLTENARRSLEILKKYL